MGVESDTEAWTAHGGRWRRVRRPVGRDPRLEGGLRGYEGLEQVDVIAARLTRNLCCVRWIVRAEGTPVAG
jgi:hypothetical protein